MIDLKQLVLLGVNGGLGLAVYWCLNNVKGIREWYAAIERPDIKRWIAAGITGVLGVACWGAGIGLGYFPVPGTSPQSWIEAVVNVLIGAIAGFYASTLTHTTDLKARYVREAEAKQRADAGRYRGR